MCRPVAASTVLTSNSGPPKANAALILFSPYPGIPTHESRGIETSVGAPISGTCMIMIVSVR